MLEAIVNNTLDHLENCFTLFERRQIGAVVLQVNLDKAISDLRHLDPEVSDDLAAFAFQLEGGVGLLEAIGVHDRYRAWRRDRNQVDRRPRLVLVEPVLAADADEADEAEPPAPIVSLEDLDALLIIDEGAA